MPRPKSNLSQTVFVRYSPPNPAVTHTLLTETFSEYGPVKKCSVIRNAKPDPANNTTHDAAGNNAGGGSSNSVEDAKRTKGYGFVRFASPEDALEAVAKLNGTYLQVGDYGDRVKLFVERAVDATAPGSKDAQQKKEKRGEKREKGEKGGGDGRKSGSLGGDAAQREGSAADATKQHDHRSGHGTHDQAHDQARQQHPELDEAMTRRKRTARVILRNLAFSAKESHIRRTMEEKVGAVVDIHLPAVPGAGASNADGKEEKEEKKKGGKGAKRGMVPRHRGFAFVTFENAALANKAVEMGTAVVKGREVAIDYSVSKFHHKRMAEEEEAQKEDEEEVEEKEEEEDDEGSDSGSSSDSDSEEDSDSDSDDNNDNDSDDDSGSDEENDDDDADQADAKGEEESTMHRPKPKNDPRRTLFVRNVPFDAARTDLFEIFRHYGRIESIYLVKDRDTGVGKGTAFVRYETESSSKRALEAAGSTGGASGPFVSEPGEGGQLSGTEGLYLSGRRLLIDPAVDRDTASSLKVERDEDGKPLERKVGKDKRNLYLSNEGRVASGTPEDPGPWEELPESDRQKRGKAHSEKASKMRSPLFFVNPYRLSIRNLAKHVDESDLKKLAVRGIQAGLDGNLVTKEDVVAHWRASGDMTARDIVHKITEMEQEGESIVPPYDESAGIRRYVPSVFIDRDFGGSGSAGVSMSKKDLPPSRGFGFVEFTHHAHALACLRELNNNAAYSAEFATGGKKATEMKKRLRKGGKKGKKGRNLDADGEGGAADFVGDDGRVRIPRLIVEFTVENKAKAKKQADNRAQQLANAEKQKAASRAAKKEKQLLAKEAGDEEKTKLKKKKKGRGALQRERKRKQKEEGTTEQTEETERSKKKARKVSHDDAEVAKEPKQPKMKPIKPPKKRKVDKEEQAFESMVRTYKQAFAGGDTGNKKQKKGNNDKSEVVAANPRSKVASKRWFD